MPWLWAATGSVSNTVGAARPAGAEQHRAGVVGFACNDAARAAVEAVEPGRQRRAERCEVGLADDERVGECGLPRRLREAVEGLRTGHRVDQGDDPGQMQAVVEHRVGAEGVEDRRRVGEAGGLDDDTAEGADLA